MSTIEQLLAAATARISNSSDSARLDAQVLLCHLLDKQATWLIAHADEALPDSIEEDYQQLIEQRAKGRPVAHLTGLREFWSLSLEVTQDTLIPRPETETLIETILERFDHSHRRVIDLGTGSGAIAIALATERPGWSMMATDIEEASLSIARKNAERHGADIEFVLSDWFDAVPETNFELIVSNPPYIAEDDPHLAQGDVRFEPRRALTSGSDGLDDVRRIVSSAVGHLAPDGWLVLEHGYDQRDAIHAIFEDHGYTEIVQMDDLAGNPRLTMGRWCRP